MDKDATQQLLLLLAGRLMAVELAVRGVLLRTARSSGDADAWFDAERPTALRLMAEVEKSDPSEENQKMTEAGHATMVRLFMPDA